MGVEATTYKIYLFTFLYGSISVFRINVYNADNFFFRKVIVWLRHQFPKFYYSGIVFSASAFRFFWQLYKESVHWKTLSFWMYLHSHRITLLFGPKLQPNDFLSRIEEKNNKIRIFIRSQPHHNIAGFLKISRPWNTYCDYLPFERASFVWQKMRHIIYYLLTVWILKILLKFSSENRTLIECVFINLKRMKHTDLSNAYEIHPFFEIDCQYVLPYFEISSTIDSIGEKKWIDKSIFPKQTMLNEISLLNKIYSKKFCMNGWVCRNGTDSMGKMSFILQMVM